MCLCAQNSIRGSRQWSTLWFALWSLFDEWLMPPGKCPRFTITKTMALDTEHRSLGFHTDRSSSCCFLLNPKCWLPIHATSPEHRDTHKGNSQLTQWLVEKNNNSFFHRSLSPIFHIVKNQEMFPFFLHVHLCCPCVDANSIKLYRFQVESNNALWYSSHCWLKKLHRYGRWIKRWFKL